MPQSKKSLLTRFLIWRAKHISQREFVYILSIIVGFTSGLGAVILKNLTHYIQLLLEGRLIQKYSEAVYFAYPLIGFALVYLMIRYVIGNKVNHGIPSTLFAISKRKGLMKRYQMVGSILTAPLTVGFGGSVGLEGPTVSTGAAISSNISRLFHMNQATRTLLIGAAAAGAMSSIFKAPIAAIIFAIEVMSLDLTLASLLPLLLASISGVLTSYFFFGSEILLPFDLQDDFIINDVPYFILLGVVAAGVSIYFTKVYGSIQNLFDRINGPIKRLLIGGVAIGVIVFLVPPLYGEGYEVMNNMVQGNPTAALKNNILNIDLSNVWGVIVLLIGLLLFKIVASAITFGAGGVGGIFAPTLFMGCIMGNCLAKILNNIGILQSPVSESNFTLVGMTGLMAGVLHAPLTAIFLIAELTGGYELFLPLMITATISYAITRYFVPYSVYTMELAKKGELITHNKDKAVLTLMDMDSVIETNFVSVYPDMTLGEIIGQAVVKSNRNIFPVLNRKTNELIGIILLDDIRSIMFDQNLYKEVKATDVMQNPPAIIEIEKDRMTQVMQKFQDSGAWNLPVVKNDQYYGFISKSKLLTAYRRKLISFTE
ncbi:cl- channel voltage-gated family protein [Galbibacter marinus]|uniref:Cl-channel voltage-gated family protein n=1 Tax=Galbibacter marinus TaxID=555500 RepID=K2Q743_9FLAO|nr:chloride channel protein [Galbibacter marinus]EKF56696.1 cl- channel voltage-gated family protein [Galbibacter marinus]